MRPQLLAHAHRQLGVVTRAQALTSGYTEDEVRTLVRQQKWVTVHRGCYALGEVWRSLDDRERYRMRVVAVSLVTQGDAVVSHHSAAVLAGLPLISPAQDVHLTRSSAKGRVEHGVHHHVGALPREQVEIVEGVCRTAGARTVADLARDDGYRAGLVAGDAFLREGGSRVELRSVVRGMRRWPGVQTARVVAEDADGRSQSVGETLLRELVGELGIGIPVPQVLITDGIRTAYADIGVSWHLFEFDGKVKYGRDRAFQLDRTPEELLWDEKRREDWARGLGLGHGVSRAVWDELFGAARARTKARLRQEAMATRARVGELAWLERLVSHRRAS